MAAPKPTPIFRFAHIDNLAVCLRRGALHAPNHVPNDGLTYRTIHNVDIQKERHVTPIPCGPGGTIHDYVSFYFGYLSPMMLQLNTQRVAGYDEDQTPLIYLVSTAQAVQASGAGFVFSDGHGMASFTEWFDDLADLVSVDWDMVYQKFWADDPTGDNDRQRRKQAEFLVYQYCPWSLIEESASSTRPCKARSKEFLTNVPPCTGRLCVSEEAGIISGWRRREMIELTEGNILTADAEALVNTVNCVGYMGRGIALQFKQAFPENFRAYERACRDGEVQPGRMHIFRTGMITNPKYIINFPTKKHWRGKSRYEYIRSGLDALVAEVQRLGIYSIAVPPLGCGLGGLEWGRVRSMIAKALGGLPDVQVRVFEPHGAPEAKAMPVRTEKPRMTSGRALFVKLMDQYLTLAYRLTLLEIQKLAYFLQEAGEPLRLRYEAGPYGPYAHNLNKVLERTEGHFTRGYGDSQRPDAEIELLPDVVAEADCFLAGNAESRARLDRVAEVIEGFETPYGMELLSSVHWAARRGTPAAATAEEAVSTIHDWTPRKKAMFRAKHIQIAWNRLEQLDWLPSRACGTGRS